MTRMEWVSGIYQEMTGEAPLESFWETPTGRRIKENNPTALYDQPTANLYQIIDELPAETRSALLRQLRGGQSENALDDERLLVNAICDSAFRFYSMNESLFRRREIRHQPGARNATGMELRRL